MATMAIGIRTHRLHTKTVSRSVLTSAIMAASIHLGGAFINPNMKTQMTKNGDGIADYKHNRAIVHIITAITWSS